MRIVSLAAVGVASAVQFAVLAISGLILARLLSVDEFAITRVVTAYMVVLTMLGHFCLHDGMTSYVAGAKSEREKSEYVVGGSYMVVGISTICALIAETIIYASGLWVSPLKEALAVTVLFLPVASLGIVYASLLQAVGRYRNLVLITVLGGVVPAVALCATAALWQLPGWLVGRSLSYCILLIAGLWLCRPLFKKITVGTSVPYDLFRFARVQIISGALSMLIQVVDVIVMERLAANLSEVAVYGLASQLSKSVLFLPGALGRVFFREIAEAARDGKEIWRSVRYFLLITAAICGSIAIAVYVFGPPLIKSLYGPLYVQSIPVLKVMCLGIIANGLWTVLSVTNVAIRRPSYSVAISVTGLTVAIVLLTVLVPSYGATGAAWAMNAAYILGFIVGLLMLLFVDPRKPHCD